MKKLMLILLLCAPLCFGQTPGETSFTGEYAYWSDSGDYESVVIGNRDGSWTVLLTGRGCCLSMTAALEGTVLTAGDGSGDSYLFTLNGEYELRMSKQYRTHTSPEDIEWVFYRKD